MIKIDMEKLEQLYELSNIPGNCGEQFINIHLSLNRTINYGTIYYGFDWKCEMGEVSFDTLDEGIEEVKKLIKTYKPSPPEGI